MTETDRTGRERSRPVAERARSTARRWAVDRRLPRPGRARHRRSRRPHRRGGVVAPAPGPATSSRRSAPSSRSSTCAPEAVRMDALRSGRAPVLDTHRRAGTRDVLGRVIAARIEAGRGYATLQFSGADDVEPVWQRVADGTLQSRQRRLPGASLRAAARRRHRPDHPPRGGLGALRDLDRAGPGGRGRRRAWRGGPGRPRHRHRTRPDHPRGTHHARDDAGFAGSRAGAARAAHHPAPGDPRDHAAPAHARPSRPAPRRRRPTSRPSAPRPSAPRSSASPATSRCWPPPAAW